MLTLKKELFFERSPGETKHEEGRILYLDEELMEEMRVLHSRRHLACPNVFHRNGSPIKDFRGAWGSACIKAGLFEILKDDIGNVVTDSKGRPVKVPTKILHDFRRTAIRDMVKSGVSERVAMRILGHKTRNVFDRYNIVSDQDLREAAQKKQAYFEKPDATIKPIDQKRGKVIQAKQANNE